MTRVAPAGLLGLSDRGHLGVDARADIAVYRLQSDRAAMFRNAALVFKDGVLAMREGSAVQGGFGRVLHVRPGYDAAIDRRFAEFCDEVYGVPHTAFDVPGSAAFEAVPCRS